MILHRHNYSKWEGSLSEVFLHIYPASVVQQLYREHYLPAIGRTNAPQIKKDGMCTALASLETEAEVARAFFATMSPGLRSALFLVSHCPELPVQDLEVCTGERLLVFADDKPNAYRLDDFVSEVNPACGILCFQAYSNYRTYIYNSPKNEVVVSLPPAIARLCIAHLCEPAEWKLQSTPGWSPPSQATFLFNASDHALRDTAQVCDFLTRHKVAFTQAGRLVLPSVKKLSGFLEDREFFPTATKSPLPQHVRAKMLGNFIHCSNSAAQLLDFPGIEQFRQLMRNIGSFLTTCLDEYWDILVPHLRPQHKDQRLKSPPEAAETLLKCFTTAQPGTWVTMESLRFFISTRRHRLLNRNVSVCLVFSRAVLLGDRWKAQNHIYLTPYNCMEIWCVPLVQGMAFLLASLGWAEIAYEKPVGTEHFRQSNNEWMTPFDGLRAVRLLPLGAYALGLTEHYKAESIIRDQTKIDFSTEQLLVRLQDPNPATKTFFDDHLEHLGNGLFRFDRSRFLRGCRSGKEVSIRVQDFAQKLPGEIPPNWLAALKNLADSAQQLILEKDWSVYRLPPGSPLVNLIFNDPSLAILFRKVGGGRVAIRNSDWPGARNLLASHGFYL